MKETAVLINTRDRPTELAMLLQSIKTQTYQDFDIFILDDQGGTALNSYHFMNCMIARLKLEGHRVFVRKTDFALGVSKARHEIVNWAKKTADYKYLCRVDDDVVLEDDFFERLIKVIEAGYDLASGVTPPMAGPTFIRDPQYIKDVGNRVILDEEGNYKYNGDDFGMEYTESRIIPAHHFRSSALYKTEIHNKVNYVPTNLSKHGFREEQIFSFKCLMNGFKIGVDTAAVAWHQQTPSGGERFSDQNELVQFNEKQLRQWTKQNKDKLIPLLKTEDSLDDLEYLKETNLAK